MFRDPFGKKTSEMNLTVDDVDIFLFSSTGKITFDRLFGLGTRNMASSGRLLGLQLPPVPSHLSDYMPSCVRSTHTGDAKECSSFTELLDLPLQAPRTTSSAGLSAFTSFCSKMKADVNVSLEPSQSESHSSFALSSSAQQIEVVKQVDKHAASPLPSGWAPYFSLGGNRLGDAKANSLPGAQSRPTTPPEEDMSGTLGESSDGQGRGIRSNLSSMLSLEKRRNVPNHASQFMMDMSTPVNRRASKADSKAIQKESFASDMSVTRGDPSWMEDKCNDAWGIEPWHSEERNILMKTLHMMRCDIESLKVITWDDARGL